MALILTHSLGKVRRILKSVDEATFAPAADESMLINPTLPACEQRYMVVEAGAVREQTAQEKQADLDAAASVQAAYEARVSAAVAPVTDQFTALAKAFEEKQKRLDELMAKPDTDSLVKVVQLLIADVAGLTKLLQSFQDRFEDMARQKVV